MVKSVKYYKEEIINQGGRSADDLFSENNPQAGVTGQRYLPAKLYPRCILAKYQNVPGYTLPKA